MRRRPLAGASFGDKLSWLLTVTSGAALLVAGSALAVLDYLEVRRESIAALELQTRIVAVNSSAPLAFGDRASGAEMLAVFQARPRVAEAVVYDRNGEPFARYAWSLEAPPGLPPQPAGFVWHDRWLTLAMPIVDRGEQLGMLQVVLDFDQVRLRLFGNLLLSTLITAVATLLVFLFSRGIRNVLMRPIATLHNTVRAVSSSGDYSLRATKLSDDELGAFTDAFNHMLARIEQQDQEIKLARADAEAASRLKDEFLATLSHELRTPLTPILGWAQILRQVAADQPRVLQGAEVIERNARTQAQIVDDLLDMSRIISGKLRLRPLPIDLSTVVEAALETVGPAADARQITIDRRFDRPLPTVLGDSHRLQQVVWNLLSNAIKFTDHGGRVQVRLRALDRDVELAVIDSGQGIRTEFLPFVFDRFRQADSSSTRTHGGLGLGLAIARHLVELHGGTIAVDSGGPGRGAEFRVRLPQGGRGNDQAADRTPDSAASPTLPSGRLAGRRVLLVEDDSDTREIICQWLAGEGATVRAVGSAAEAFTELPRFDPDLLVSDIGMAGCDGIELIRRLRVLPGRDAERLPAVAVSAFARSDDRALALASGYQRHLAKPLEQRELIDALVVLS